MELLKYILLAAGTAYLVYRIGSFAALLAKSLFGEKSSRTSPHLQYSNNAPVTRCKHISPLTKLRNANSFGDNNTLAVCQDQPGK